MNFRNIHNIDDLLTKTSSKNLSRYLSYLLRHHPESEGITMDEQGWVSVEELLNKVQKLSMDKLMMIVGTNDKKRFEFNDDMTKIRASQGHSVDINLGYEPKEPPDILYHGTAEQNTESIMNEGINKGERHHVHLSEDIETAKSVGQRYGEPIVLSINAKDMYNDGNEFFLSTNNVWLTDNVPIQYITNVEEQDEL